MPPPYKSNATSLRPKTLLPLTTLEPPNLSLKRPKPPSPPSNQSPTELTSLKTSFASNNTNPPNTWEDGYESPTPPSDHDDSSTTRNDSDDDTNFDESIRMHEFETKLTKSVPKKLRCYISKTRLAELVHHIYIADDINTSLAQSKNDLLCQVEEFENRHKRSLHNKKSPSKKTRS